MSMTDKNSAWAVKAVESLTSPLFLLDETNRFLQANPACEDFFSLSVKSLRQRRLDELLVADSALLSLITKSRRTGLVVTGHRLELIRLYYRETTLVDGQICPLSETGHSLISLWPQSIADHLDKQFNYSNSAFTINALAAMMAHEIKNPLAGISGAAQLLEDQVTEEDKELARLIRNEVARVRRLVDQMEVFTDEREVVKGPVNIHSTLEQVERLIKADYGDRLQFKTDYDPSLPPVKANSDQLIQMLLNLVKNAAQALESTDNPVILLATSSRGTRPLARQEGGGSVNLPIVCRIVDNGPGIPDHLRGHIFDPFVTSRPSGRGLGLAFVAKVIHDHNGLIDINNLEQGTEVVIMLPSEQENRIE